MSETILTGVVIDESGALSLEEFACACGAQVQWVQELVEEGVIRPEGRLPAEWRFRSAELLRVRRVQRLQRDLGANLDAAFVILDLLDELDRLRSRLRRAGIDAA